MIRNEIIEEARDGGWPVSFHANCEWITGRVTWLGLREFEVDVDGEIKRYDLTDVCMVHEPPVEFKSTSAAIAKSVVFEGA